MTLLFQAWWAFWSIPVLVFGLVASACIAVALAFNDVRTLFEEEK